MPDQVDHGCSPAFTAEMLSAIMSVGAWLGAIRARLRSNRLPIPRFVTETSIDADASAFGARHVISWLSQSDRPIRNIEWLDQCLAEIDARTRNKPWRETLWNELITYVPTRLPSDIALDLIDHDLCVQTLGHSWQVEAVWWRVAERVPEAVHNLAMHRYRDAESGCDRVEEVLLHFPRWPEVTRLLVSEQPSSPAKAVWLAREARYRGIAERDLPPRGRWHPEFEEAWRNSEQDPSRSTT